MTFENLHSETIYEGHTFSVEHLLTRLPDGHQKTYELVRHNESVSIVPVDSAGQIYFVEQYRIGASQNLLELPAGVLESDENAVEGAGREVREETGLAAGKLLKLGEFYLAAGYSSELMHVFLATGLTPSPLKQDADEFLSVEKIPIDQAFSLAQTGNIRDAKTLAALFLARPWIAP